MALSKPIKNCFECTGGTEMGDCPMYAPLETGELCVYKQVADNDLKKYSSGSKILTFGTMLKEYLAKHPELKKSEIGNTLIHILGTKKSVINYEQVARELNQPSQSYISIDKFILEVMSARALIIDSPLEDRSPEGKLLSSAPIDGVYAANRARDTGYKGKIYIFGNTNTQPLLPDLSFYPEGPLPELIKECFGIIMKT